MTTFTDFLDAYKAARGVTTDKELGEQMGKSGAYVSQLRRLGIAPDELCLEMARVLNVEPGMILLSRDALKQSGAVGEAYRRVLEQLQRVAIIPLTVGAVLLAGNGVQNDEIRFENKDIPLLKITGILKVSLNSMIWAIIASITRSNTSRAMPSARAATGSTFVAIL